jgi:ribosomal-protein-alanine N-acetyltransferase
MPSSHTAALPTLTTERLTLREIADGDAPDLLIFRGDPEVQRYNTKPMTDLAEARSLIRTMQYWLARRQALQWGITLTGERRVLGICGLHDWSHHDRSAFLGYDLTREHWGRGIATEAVRAVLVHGFEQMELHRVEAVTIVDNVRSIRLLERVGFRLEGVRRESSLEDDGQFHGRAIYGLLRPEFRR